MFGSDRTEPSVTGGDRLRLVSRGEMRDEGAAVSTRRRYMPIKLADPKVVPISKEDYDLAVSALASMIVEWWRAQSPTTPPTAAGPVVASCLSTAVRTAGSADGACLDPLNGPA
jgi:hypothetical protein